MQLDDREQKLKFSDGSIIKNKTHLQASTIRMEVGASRQTVINKRNQHCRKINMMEKHTAAANDE